MIGLSILILEYKSIKNGILQPRRRMIQNYLIIWLYSNTNKINDDYQNTPAQLRNIANDFYLFTNTDQCIDFLTGIDEQKAFMIISGTVDQHLVLNIHEIPKLQAVYICCSKKTQHEQSGLPSPKIRNGVQKVPDGIHVRYNIFRNVVHLWGT